MRYAASLAAAAALSNVALGAPAPEPQLGNLLTMGVDAFTKIANQFFGKKPPPSLQDIQNAQIKWQADTGIVSQFLSNAESYSPQDRKKQGAAALKAENDELTHKAVLDRQFNSGPNPDQSVKDANEVLVDQGTFQVVVDALKAFADHGDSMTDKQVSAIIQFTNQDRCTYVLPAIDKYMQAAREILPTDIEVKAVRPDNCP